MLTQLGTYISISATVGSGTGLQILVSYTPASGKTFVPIYVETYGDPGAYQGGLAYLYNNTTQVYLFSEGTEILLEDHGWSDYLLGNGTVTYSIKFIGGSGGGYADGILRGYVY